MRRQKLISVLCGAHYRYSLHVCGPTRHHALQHIHYTVFSIHALANIEWLRTYVVYVLHSHSAHVCD